MIRGPSARPSAISEQPSGVIERVFDGHQWRVAASHAALIDSRAVDWFHLVEGPETTLVKRNSQRDVWCVRVCGGEYFAKLYHPTGGMARLKSIVRGPIARAEWNIGRYAADHGISAVVPVATAWADGRWTGGISLLITQAVLDAVPLGEYWQTVREDRWQANLLSDSLARLIARSHQCGFQHGDMHPGNILVRRIGQRCEAFFVDLHRVHTGRRVAPRRAVANLAQLNQWFRRNASRSQRLRFLDAYIDYRDQFAQASSLARNWRIDTGRLVADLAAQADRHAYYLWAKRDRRTLRTSRYFARIRPAPGWRGHVLLTSKHPCPATGAAGACFTKAQWEDWLRYPLAWVDPRRQELLKDSHTAVVCRARLGTSPDAPWVVVKRPLARNFWKKLAAVFGPSRTLRSWKMANRLRNRDLPVAQPLAVLERFALGLIRTDSIGITEYVDGASDLETFLTRDVAALPAGRRRVVKDRVIESVVRLLKAFHERGFVHRDMKAPNLMVRWAPPYRGSPALIFIDMDGIKHVRKVRESQQLRAVVRLCASLLGSPTCTASDRLRFLRSYLTGPGRTPAEWKTQWRQIHEAVCSKLQDKELRRRWKLAHYGRE